MILALGVLAMTIGLIRSETAGDLRTLSATGATSTTRRAVTAATAGALAALGAAPLPPRSAAGRSPAENHLPSADTHGLTGWLLGGVALGTEEVQ